MPVLACMVALEQLEALCMPTEKGPARNKATCRRMHHAACAPDAQGPLGKGRKDTTHGNQAILFLSHGLHFDAQMLHPVHAQQKHLGNICDIPGKSRR